MPRPLQDFTAAHQAVAEYYAQKLRRHGPTPAGADWASATGQDLRFALLLKLCDLAKPFSLNDLGCGYGALLDYLRLRHPTAEVDYLGLDVCAEMVACAARRCRHLPMARFIQAGSAPRVADYAVASGIFNVVPQDADASWTDLVAGTLSDLHRSARRGFAVNFLGVAPDQPGLFRTSPVPWINYCEHELDTEITLIQGYALNEFTILAWRKHRAEHQAERWEQAGR